MTERKSVRLEDLEESVRHEFSKRSAEGQGWKNSINSLMTSLGPTDHLSANYIWLKNLAQDSMQTAREDAEIVDPRYKELKLDHQSFYKEIKMRIMMYVEQHLDEWGLCQNRDKPGGTIYRKELLQKIRVTGEDLMRRYGGVTNRKIAINLGMMPDNRNMSFIKGVITKHHYEWKWEIERGDPVKYRRV